MPKVMQNEMGKITVTEDVIATIAGFAALDCYGLVGMASQKRVKDSITELLGRENPGRGVEVYIHDDRVTVDLFIIVSYGTKISVVANNVMDKVKYTLENALGIEVDQINVNVQGVRVTDK
ncbi:Asp23/Gls24 family envelope stress response protein [Effusibacillus dendaii]|uniref:Asp23/Gls24 family envelope stress response protein n=1 Tax=Effusibacillus dendaii TaxID=2743772 RepID=A0A7I8D6W9_9BACL|nr:Asp23/Gls24 family envelope stress response protein [Effusibacillus dendaii]BCJ85132.1 Asp23/Gls24 family envelope stress response protein [Effusibacillus dendaii]